MADCDSAAALQCMGQCLVGARRMFLGYRISLRQNCFPRNECCGKCIFSLPFCLPDSRSHPDREMENVRENRFLVVISRRGVGVPVQFLMQFKGLQLTTVSHASLIVGTLPVLIALSSTLFLHEKLSKSEWVVLLLSPAGVGRPSGLHKNRESERPWRRLSPGPLFPSHFVSPIC